MQAEASDNYTYEKMDESIEDDVPKKKQDSDSIEDDVPSPNAQKDFYLDEENIDLGGKRKFWK